MSVRVRHDPRTSETIDECARRSIALLRRNLSPAGILAATPTARARSRGYHAIFARDAAISALGMAVTGDALLEREAASGLRTLARHQAPNGQIPNYVDPAGSEVDFWYLGCIDATLWWLVALAGLDRLSGSILRRTLSAEVDAALRWLACQEHQRFFLLQQNEASDWADIMPRSGFVLYTNTLWYYVKRLYGIAHAAATRTNFNGLFHPFTERLAEYRRGRLLAHYALRKARRRALYLSFVNFSFFGDEGDVFGNLLAILLGLADEQARERTLRALLAARVHEPYPVRVVVRPIARHDSLWRSYMSRHRQNLAWQYHNGGIWPMVGGFWVAALAACGRRELAQAQLLPLARACALGNWRFTEWLHGRTLTMRGMPGQSWNAAAYLLAAHCVSGAAQPFAHPAKRDRLHT